MPISHYGPYNYHDPYGSHGSDDPYRSGAPFGPDTPFGLGEFIVVLLVFAGGVAAWIWFLNIYG